MSDTTVVIPEGNQDAAQDAATQVAGAVAIAETIVDAAEQIAEKNAPVDRTHEIIALISEARDDIRAVRSELSDLRQRIDDARYSADDAAAAANTAASAAIIAAAAENSEPDENPAVVISDSEGAEVEIVKQDAPDAGAAVVRAEEPKKSSRRWL